MNDDFIVVSISYLVCVAFVCINSCVAYVVPSLIHSLIYKLLIFSSIASRLKNERMEKMDNQQQQQQYQQFNASG